MYPPNLNVPLPDPSQLAPEQTLQQPPDRMQQALSMIVPLFSLGAALGGSPQSGAAFLHGAHQTLEKQRIDRENRAYQQQQIEVRNQAIQAQERARMAAVEQDREAAMQKATVDLVTQWSKVATSAQSRVDYEHGLSNFANLASLTGVRVGPDQLRQFAPFVPPDAGKAAYDAIDKMLKSPANAEAVKSGQIVNAMIAIPDPERRGQFIRMPMQRAIELSGYPIAQNPDGTLFVGDKSSDTKLTGDAAALYNQYKKIAQLENREITPKGDLELQKRAIKEAADLKRNESPDAGAGGIGGPISNQTQLTPEGLDLAATKFRLTGEMPALGMGKNPDRSRIINAAAAQAKALRQTPVEAIQKQNAYKADSASLAQMTKMKSAAQAYESKASAQADLVRGLSAKVTRTQYPLINQAILSGKIETGDPEAQAFVNAITTFSTEYAKIMEGSTGSAQGSTDASRRAAARLVGARLNPEQLNRTLDLMQREMQLALQGYDVTIGNITKNMGGQTPGQTPAPTAKPISAASQVGDVVSLPDGSIVTITEKTRTGFKYKRQ